MKTDLPYFESDAQVAQYLSLGVAEFLRLRNSGKFAVTPRPVCPALVYWRVDVDRWLAAGRPVGFPTRDPAGLLPTGASALNP